MRYYWLVFIVIGLAAVFGAAMLGQHDGRKSARRKSKGKIKAASSSELDEPYEGIPRKHFEAMGIGLRAQLAKN